ncbi:hypothetical protein FPZ12_033865 [Amycolatopsis acidicola]|uniref:LPXTG cell wall anchor domain-containing protein n=1 Tax=Amycolatopsis acidicola TaxID=2596893 RepID=A0A5N0UX08_9PSEU|nr:hypothetical protein FPZ12_033865 [Amycolatopsis acidicola]
MLRVGIAFTVLVGAGTGVASAADTTTTDTTASFGLLGPVGLAAVLLGVVGMALGVVRARRKAQAEQEAAVVAEAAEVTENAESPSRPALTPYRRPSA